MEHAGPEALRTVDEDGDTCVHLAAVKGHLPMLQWIVGEATLCAADNI